MHHIVDNVYVSSAPSTTNVQTIRSQNIRYVVCLQEERERMRCEMHDICVLNLPTRDYSSPTEKSLKDAVSFIRLHQKDGVLVHCRAGKGRSVACVIAYICETRKVGFGPAYSHVSRRRRIARRSSRCFALVKEKYKDPERILI